LNLKKDKLFPNVVVFSICSSLKLIKCTQISSEQAGLQYKLFFMSCMHKVYRFHFAQLSKLTGHLCDVSKPSHSAKPLKMH